MLQIDNDAYEEIVASFQSWQDAWNNGDIEGFLESYWQSDSVRYVSGNQMVIGFDAIAKRYRDRYIDNPDVIMGRMRLFIDADFATSDEALIFGKYQALDETDTLLGHGVFTAHLRKLNGQWKIISDHASALND